MMLLLLLRSYARNYIFFSFFLFFPKKIYFWLQWWYEMMCTVQCSQFAVLWITLKLILILIEWVFCEKFDSYFRIECENWKLTTNQTVWFQWIFYICNWIPHNMCRMDYEIALTSSFELLMFNRKNNRIELKPDDFAFGGQTYTNEKWNGYSWNQMIINHKALET